VKVYLIENLRYFWARFGFFSPLLVCHTASAEEFAAVRFDFAYKKSLLLLVKSESSPSNFISSFLVFSNFLLDNPDTPLIHDVIVCLMAYFL